MSSGRPVVKALVRLAVLAGGAFAGYLLLSLFGGPAHADDGGLVGDTVSTVAEAVDEVSDSSTVSDTVDTVVSDPVETVDDVEETVATVTETFDDVSRPVLEVVEETAGADLDPQVDELTGPVDSTVDTAEETAAPGGEPPTTATGPIDPVVPPAGEAAGVQPGSASAPASVGYPTASDDSPTAEVTERARGPATVRAPVIPLAGPARPTVHMLNPERAAEPAAPAPASPFRTHLPAPGFGQVATGAADPAPPAPATPPEPRLPDASAGRAVLHEHVSGSGLVMPVGAPPG